MAAGDALQFWKDSVSWFALLHTMAVVACIIVLLAMYSKAKAIVEDALTFDLELFDRIVGRSVIVVLIVDTLRIPADTPAGDEHSTVLPTAAADAAAVPSF